MESEVIVPPPKKNAIKPREYMCVSGTEAKAKHLT